MNCVINCAPTGNFTPLHSLTNAFHVHKLFKRMVFCLCLSAESPTPAPSPLVLVPALEGVPGWEWLGVLALEEGWEVR